MQKIFTLCVSIFSGAMLFTASVAADMSNTLTDADKNDGWTILFDGTSLAHWKGFKREDVPSAWSIQSGALFFNPTVGDGNSDKRGSIISREEYEDFELKLEWKISPKGNSGIFFHIVEDEKFARAYHTAPEMQVLDDTGHNDGNIYSHRAGDLFDLVASAQKMAKPVGEWNKVRIRLKDSNLRFYLNGYKVVETTMWDEDWNNMVAASKFANWAGFAKARNGHIGLQDHGDPVWYRNIKIRRLD